ncbi:MAG: helix-turn-helix transcriptional regulator [Syntrophales bacterium]|jgi:excisionase family DNA binding protein|nr:helix-turn-helix transcriptional regulator [Syntrophales bacterium]MDY0044376.1 helix-turn-helix transcriptional regulator [Syntrophales bacterium]
MNDMLTTKELAALLRLNEKKVYELVREGIVPHVRIAGKWLFPRKHVMRWIDENVEREKDLHVVGSDDILLGRLLTHYSRENIPRSIAYYAAVGSMEGVAALSQGKGQACCAHILDIETGEYNIPFLSRTLTDMNYVVVNLWYRKQGLIVKKGNPLGIRNIVDIAEKKARFAGRNKGSGTDVLFEYLMFRDSIQKESLKITNIVDSHLEVASKVFFDEADAGLGIEYVTHPLGLEFIPLKDERFDLIVPKELWAANAMVRIKEYLHPGYIVKISKNIPGYNLKDTGKVIYSK